MGFFAKLKRAIIKIKGKLTVSAILVLIIIGWAIAPFSVSMKNGLSIKQELWDGTFMWEDPNENAPFSWDTFLLDLAHYITHPLEAVKLCFTQHEDTGTTRNYTHAFLYITRWSLSFYAIFVFVGIARAFPKHEYTDIEHGSSDWSENGEQYRVLHRSKGIILAEKNYLPVDKRGNVNVLVVRRLWCR